MKLEQCFLFPSFSFNEVYGPWAWKSGQGRIQRTSPLLSRFKQGRR